MAHLMNKKNNFSTVTRLLELRAKLNCTIRWYTLSSRDFCRKRKTTIRKQQCFSLSNKDLSFVFLFPTWEKNTRDNGTRGFSKRNSTLRVLCKTLTHLRQSLWMNQKQVLRGRKPNNARASAAVHCDRRADRKLVKERKENRVDAINESWLYHPHSVRADCKTPQSVRDKNFSSARKFRRAREHFVRFRSPSPGGERVRFNALDIGEKHPIRCRQKKNNADTACPKGKARAVTGQYVRINHRAVSSYRLTRIVSRLFRIGTGRRKQRLWERSISGKCVILIKDKKWG